MANEPLLAGVDVGTTNIKAVIFEPDGQIMAEASTPTIIHYPQPGWAYYDPEEMWHSVVTVLRQATGQLAAPGRIAGVAVASVGEAGVPLPSVPGGDERLRPYQPGHRGEQPVGKPDVPRSGGGQADEPARV